MNHAMFFTQAVVARHEASVRAAAERERLVRRSTSAPRRRVGTTYARRTWLDRRHQAERPTAPAGVAMLS